MCYVICINAFFCNVYSIGPINMCTDFEINRYKIDEFRKYAKIVFYLTHKRYVVRHGDTSDRYFYQEYFETNQKSLPLTVQKLWLKQWFSCFRWSWPWSLTNVLFCHTHCSWCTGISMRSFKSYGSNSGFHVFGDLDLELWPMFCFVTRTAHDVLKCEVS